MFSEQFFDLLLDFGDDWKVERVYVNIVTEEVDVFVDYIGKYAEDPHTLSQSLIYDHAPLRRWRHLDNRVVVLSMLRVSGSMPSAPCPLLVIGCNCCKWL